MTTRPCFHSLSTSYKASPRPSHEEPTSYKVHSHCCFALFQKNISFKNTCSCMFRSVSWHCLVYGLAERTSGMWKTCSIYWQRFCFEERDPTSSKGSEGGQFSSSSSSISSSSSSSSSISSSSSGSSGWCPILTWPESLFLPLSLKLRLHDTTCCQTGCETGLTTGCIVYTSGFRRHTSTTVLQRDFP